jgi:hypothetical protein
VAVWSEPQHRAHGRLRLNCCNQQGGSGTSLATACRRRTTFPTIKSHAREP